MNHKKELLRGLCVATPSRELISLSLSLCLCVFVCVCVCVCVFVFVCALACRGVFRCLLQVVVLSEEGGLLRKVKESLGLFSNSTLQYPTVIEVLVFL